MTKSEHADVLLERLEVVLARHAPLAVAVSGGVDSMTLAFVAHRHHPGTQVFHALSPAVPTAATERVRRHAAAQGWHLRVIDAGEMRDADYLRNPVNRCYYCKSNLYRTILAQASGKVIASGTNLDDLGDFRPGLRAAGEQGVVHPLVEAGIDKAGVRSLAGYFGLHDLQELPASPCLSSRVSTGIAIEAGLLPVIDRAETEVRALLDARGAAVRCRLRADHLALEVDADLLNASDHCRDAVRERVSEVFVAAGYAHLVARVSVEAYRQGSAFLRVRQGEGTP